MTDQTTTQQNTKSSSTQLTLGTLLSRGLRRRCPSCGLGKIFKSWVAMRELCEECGRKYNREPGFLLGSIYFNYGVTALLVTILYFGLYFTNTLTNSNRLLVVGAVSLFFPCWFFRYARSMWIAFDEKFDPWPNEKELRELKKKKQKK